MPRAPRVSLVKAPRRSLRLGLGADRGAVAEREDPALVEHDHLVVGLRPRRSGGSPRARRCPPRRTARAHARGSPGASRCRGRRSARRAAGAAAGAAGRARSRPGAAGRPRAGAPCRGARSASSKRASSAAARRFAQLAREALQAGGVEQVLHRPRGRGRWCAAGTPRRAAASAAPGRARTSMPKIRMLPARLL